MRRVESCAALAPLLSAQLRRGVVTNCFLSPADYQREIDAGLFYEEGDGFLLLLRQRAGYRLLNFYLHPGAKLCLPGQTLPLVTELACREKDQDAMRRAQDALCALGFAECFRRLRRAHGRRFRLQITRKLRRRLPLRLCGRFYLNSSTR